MRILVVEDEKKLAGFLRNGLTEEGFAVDVSHNGNDAYALAISEPYDAIVLDIMLPGRDGLSILKKLREKRNNVPVLVLTARGEVSERIEGLNLGADDYLTKPFSIAEVIARVRALLRRESGGKSTILQFADLRMNLLTREVMRGGTKIELTTREFALLEFFMHSPRQVHTRTAICEHVWDYHFDPGTNVVDVYMQRLRRKIDEGFSRRLLHTVRGVGFAMKEDQ